MSAPRLAFFASGGGSNIQAVLDYCGARADACPYTPVLVISNHAYAYALERARSAGLAVATLHEPADGAALVALLESHGITLIALAGYLKLVPAAVTERYRGAVVNVHPALLPAHGGLGMYGRHVHRAVLAAGDNESGATVHFVDAAYDRGASIAQARVPVFSSDTAELLAQRVLVAEHALLPRALHALARGLVRLTDTGAVEWLADPRTVPEIPPSDILIDFSPRHASRSAQR